MRKHAEPKSTYEDFCKVFAALYRKEVRKLTREYFTCYVRAGIRNYIWADAADRAYLIGSEEREYLLGYRIAKALLAQGMTKDQIIKYERLQQSYVNEMEDAMDDTDVLADALRRKYEYVTCAMHDLSTARSALVWGYTVNEERWEWLASGAPDLLAAYLDKYQD